MNDNRDAENYIAAVLLGIELRFGRRAADLLAGIRGDALDLRGLGRTIPETVTEIGRWYGFEPPAGSHRVTRDGTEMFRGTANACFVYVLRHQGESVHYATRYGDWRIEPVRGAATKG
jgi:hypothetical protein